MREERKERRGEIRERERKDEVRGGENEVNGERQGLKYVPFSFLGTNETTVTITNRGARALVDTTSLHQTTHVARSDMRDVKSALRRRP